MRRSLPAVRPTPIAGTVPRVLSDQCGRWGRGLLAATMPRKSRALPPSPFRRFNSSPEVIRLVVLMYVRFPLSLRNVEDLLFERGVDVSHETIRFWWNRFGPMFAGEVRQRRVSYMRGVVQINAYSGYMIAQPHNAERDAAMKALGARYEAAGTLTAEARRALIAERRAIDRR